ncbi:MAG: asparagine synthase-related protein [Chloroflexota bacterium]|nr:asparagine synthase-related protein [Chloroflexota bacterium]
MAGFAGIRSSGNGSAGVSPLLEGIIERIKHRGQGETWTQQVGEVNLACRELNVGGEAEAGSHHIADGKRAVVLDGRIYNPEKSNLTDAEILLRFYDKFGPQFAKKLDGDFACAIADNGKLILARDAVGVRPLYYGHSDGKLCFASEAKGLVDIADDVKEFPPGYVYSSALGFQKYAPQAVETPDFESCEQAKKVLVRLLEEAVEKRMKDNAVGGIFLSGGLDSSIVACIAKEIKLDIEAFTVSLENGQDLPLARDVTRRLGIKHHVYIFTEKEISEILPQAIYHMESFEESCIHGALANFLASRFVSRHANCVLTGEGADEFLGGYDGQFRQAKNPEEVAGVVDKLINVSHNTALQRLDRLVAAYSMEARTPFLDSKVVDFCLKIPLDYKIHGSEQTGKWILRQGFHDRLSEHIIFQAKRFFAQGSGVAGVMRTMAQRHVSNGELLEHLRIEDNPRLSSIEELYYYRIFKEKFPQPVSARLVGRWDPFKPDFFAR